MLHFLYIAMKVGFCMKKKLVVIGANDFQNQLIIKAKKRGFETHVFAWEEGAVGKENADYFYPISITEKEEILKQCQKIQPSGIISIASDLASVTVNYVAEKMNLTGNGIESSLLSTNKYLMRQAFERANVPSPLYVSSDDITENLITKLTMPVIIKPVDRSGSRGVNKIEDKNEIENAIEIAKEQSFSKKAIIEEFVDGEEFSVEYISWLGKHTFLAMTKKYTTEEPHFIETGHMQPAKVSNDLLQKVQSVVENALDALKIKNGASHSELKIDRNGNIKVIEIGGRMGGDCIGSDLVELSTGYDFVNMVIDIACDLEPTFEQVCQPHQAEVKFLFTEEDCRKLEVLKQKTPERLYRISDIDKNTTAPILDSSTRLGYYILRGEPLK